MEAGVSLRRGRQHTSVLNEILIGPGQSKASKAGELRSKTNWSEPNRWQLSSPRQAVSPGSICLEYSPLFTCRISSVHQPKSWPQSEESTWPLFPRGCLHAPRASPAPPPQLNPVLLPFRDGGRRTISRHGGV